MKKALVLIDVQNDYFAGGAMPLTGANEASYNAALIVAKFRTSGLPIVHVKHTAARPGASFFLPGSAGAAIHSSVEPKHAEKIIEKHAPNCFKDTELLGYLTSVSITDLVICGMMTHMCVDSTVRAARDLGFRCILIGDACATRDLDIQGQQVNADQVQKSFLAALGYYYAAVMTTSQYLASE